MNPVIKFSHHYLKLKTPTGFVKKAILLDVLRTDLKNLSPIFLSYDTTYGVGKNYPLPKSGKYLMLIFGKCYDGSTTEIFTTLRRLEFEKYKFYKDLIGKVFDVEIVEK